jgi:PAB-dependent poly(A)-specific ribonuclease subunit 2
MTTYAPLQLLQLPPTVLDANPIPTALTIDPFSDLIWVGSSSGLVSALCSPASLTRNVQFPAHGAQAVGGYMGHASSMAVKEIRVTDRDVWTLTDGGVGGRKRGGAVKWSVSDPTRSLASMTPNPANSNEVVAGGNGLMLANTSTGQIVRRVSSETSNELTKGRPPKSSRAFGSSGARHHLGVAIRLDIDTGSSSWFQSWKQLHTSAYWWPERS